MQVRFYSVSSGSVGLSAQPSDRIKSRTKRTVIANSPSTRLTSFLRGVVLRRRIRFLYRSPAFGGT